MAKKRPLVSRRKIQKLATVEAGLEETAGFDVGEDFDPIFSLLQNQINVDFSNYKPTTIGRRLQRQMRLDKFSVLADYVQYLRTHPEAVKNLGASMFVHVTEFFRDPDSFQALKEHVFPELKKKKIPGVPLRIWVPGCSSGEEVYSIAMALLEYSAKSPLTFQIFASDISESAVNTARIGFYTAQQVEGLSSERLKRFFEIEKEGYKIKKSIRDCCVFSRHDLSKNPPFAKIDLISCRNVLIYFSQALQQQVMPIFHYALNMHGFLWLGRSEAPVGISKMFAPVDKNHKIYSKIGDSKTTGYHFSVKSFQADNMEAGRNTPLPAPSQDHHKEVDRILMSRFAPAGAVVNADFEIIQVRGHTAPYLELAIGQPSYNLMKMVRPELLPEIRWALQTVMTTAKPIRRENMSYQFGSERRKVDLEVIPVNPKEVAKYRQYLILFVESAVVAPQKVSAVKSKAKVKKQTNAKDVYIAELLQEIDAMRDYQQSLADGYQAAQEELSSSNEELQSTLEEFQSTNEELEAAKEELQAGNEELTTVNVELQHRNDLLTASEERFRLLVGAVKDYAIFMLDPNGIITTWNEGARRFNGYEAKEIIGQHFSKFYPQADIDAGKPEMELRVASAEGRFEEEGIRLRKDGTVFMANVVISAIRDERGTLRGFSKVTRDISLRKLAEQALTESEERYRLMVEVVKDYGIFRLDPHGYIVTWNDGARNLKGYEAKEIIGKHFSIFYAKEDIDQKKPEFELEQTGLLGRFEDEGWRLRKDKTRFWANVIMTCIYGPNGEVIGFTKVTRDLTERKMAEERLRKAYDTIAQNHALLEKRVEERTEELQKAVRARDEFVSVASHELKTPLTALRLQAQITQRNILKGDPAVFSRERLLQFANQLDSQVDRLSHLVEDMLDISRIQLGKLTTRFEETNFAELVRDVAGRFSVQLEAVHCTLEMKLDENVHGCWDRFRLEQVVLNLLSNAAKYGAGTLVQVSLYQDQGRAVFSVKDHGVGISKENQQRIFERFERAISASEVSGLGLGLYIVSEIVRAHEGAIHVKSELGKGAEFTIEIPLRPPSKEDNKRVQDYEF